MKFFQIPQGVNKVSDFLQNFSSILKQRKYFILIITLFSFVMGCILFFPLYTAKSVYLSYVLFPYDICEKQPTLWLYLKIAFIISNLISSAIIANSLYNQIFGNDKHHAKSNTTCIQNLVNKFNNTPTNFNKNLPQISPQNLQLFIGLDNNNSPVFIPESGLYQNILITGTIGSGKTSSAMYPFTKQLIYYNYFDSSKKIGMLILDVKGNYQLHVKDLCNLFGRNDDLIVLELGGKYKYNPLNKPNLKPSVLANRLKTILLLFSENNSESYWLDKAEQVLEQSIKLCRLYNNNYVNFAEIHNLVISQDYYYQKVNELKKNFSANSLSKEDCYNLLNALTFFENEFFKLDSRTLGILRSEITRITNCFVSDYQVLQTFNPTPQEENFYGLSEILSSGKIVVLNMNISEYKNLSKIIAAYLKLDFQTEVLSRLAKNECSRTVAFISDEYHEYVTKTDADFYAQSREAKCINIVATQSYTSLLKTINNDASVKVIIQNLINKIWFRTDDNFTIEEVQKQIGKEDKEKFSTSISENARETFYNYISNSLSSKNSSITESINSVIQHDFIFDSNFFTQELETFNCLAFLSTGKSIIPPQKLQLIPHFKDDGMYF